MRSVSWLLCTNLQNKTMCWLLCTNLQKKTIQARPFLLRDRKNVSISMLFQKVFLGWKLSPIINRREVGIRMSGVEKIKTIISEGTSIRHSRVNKVERDSRVVLKKLALKVAKMTQRYGF